MKQPVGLYFLVLLGAVIACSGMGCSSASNLRLEPVESKGTLIEPHFKEAYYRVDRDKNVFLVLQNRSTDRATGQAVDQVVLVRMFWIPIGGKTTLNEEALNATFRYLVMTPNAVGMYEGAGFVRISHKSIGQGTVHARIVDGDMRLTEATADFTDRLGRSRLRGDFSAKLSEVKAFDLMAGARRDFYTRSLALAGAKDVTTTGPAATEPATTLPNSEFRFP